MLITGLAQRFLEKCLSCDVSGQAKGTILEIKEERGLGTTLDVILYDGMLKVNDTIVIGSLNKPIVTKIRALLEPMPLHEMRDKKAKFKPIKAVYAATGVKIAAPEIENAIAGMPIRSANVENLEKVKQDIQAEVEEVIIETDKEGVIIKADALGSVEALTNLLKEKGIQIKKASVGDITRKDVMEAEANLENNAEEAVILGFNVNIGLDVLPGKIKIIKSDIVYKLIEDFEKWQTQLKKQMEEDKLFGLITPGKIEILKGYVFRQSNPAVVGVEIVEGKIKVGMPMMKNGKYLTEIKGIQLEKESIREAEKGKQVALSLPKVTVGRQIKEGDVLYSSINEVEFRKLKELKELLKEGEIAILKEIAEIMRKHNPLWGI